MHEALLASPHRTTDPAAADFFYVPVYGGCYISEFNRPRPDHWLCDECHKGKAADLQLLWRDLARPAAAWGVVLSPTNRSQGVSQIRGILHLPWIRLKS